MKLEISTETKYSKQEMLMGKKKKFRLAREFMLVLELKGFYSAASNIQGHFWMPTMSSTMTKTSLKVRMPQDTN